MLSNVVCVAFEGETLLKNYTITCKQIRDSVRGK